MVSSYGVINMPARIISDDREFIGQALGMPPLKEKLNDITGEISEEEVIEIAELLILKCMEIYSTVKIKGDSNSFNKLFSPWGSNLKKFIKVYSKKADELLLPLQK